MVENDGDITMSRSKNDLNLYDIVLEYFFFSFSFFFNYRSINYRITEKWTLEIICSRCYEIVK